MSTIFSSSDISSNTVYTSMDNEMPNGCGCSACMSGDAPQILTTYMDYLDNGGGGDGGDYAGKPTATPEQFADYLTDGFWQDTGRSARSWSQDTVTYSLTGFSAGQEAGIKLALDLWADVADISFSEVASGAMMAISEGNDGRAYSSSVTSGANIVSNIISMDFNVFGNPNDIGDYGLMTAIHEIGHSLGLGHTGNYNGSATYANDAQWANDSHRYSVMSYFDDTNTGSDHWGSDGYWEYSASPMLYDILAIQNIYGADYSTRAGNTTYGFNSNAGRAIYDFSVSDAPVAIWDGAGTDTIDVSGYSTNQTIYLTEGDFSSVGYMTNNLVIAYGAVIENVTSGSGNDVIYGNDVQNGIWAGAGNDTIHGSGGNDVITGREGTDELVYSLSLDNFLFDFTDGGVNGVTITNLTDGSYDLVAEVENFTFNGVTYTYAELQTAGASSLEKVAARFQWAGGEYRYNSTEVETTFIDATTMGHVGQSGNQFKVVRQVDGYSIAVQDADAAGTILLYGTDGNDSLTVQGAHNSGIAKRIEGGDGNDTIVSATAGVDMLFGEAGNDQIWAGDNDDTLVGGSGDDTLYGENGHDLLLGGLDNDTLYGGSGNDYLQGEAGADTLHGGNDGDRLEGGAGDDVLNGDAGGDKLFGDAGDDIMNGGTGEDYLYGGADNDTMNGGADRDFLYGDTGNDTLNGDAGNDKLFGEDGDDILNGGTEDDLLVGGAGADTLNGGAGSDQLDGGNDADRLNGDAGVDYLYGGAGNDTLVGGDGVDFLYGEAGDDVFGFTNIDGSIDRIKDFTYNGGNGDQINITDILSGYTPGSSDINDFVVFFAKNANTCVLKVNADGVGNDFVTIGYIAGSNMVGVSADDLISNGTLITDQSLL